MPREWRLARAPCRLSLPGRAAMKHCWLSALLLFASPSVHAFDTERLRPSTTFVQAGVAKHDTQALVVGMTWAWRWERRTSFGTATGYWEASVGRWSSEQGTQHTSAWVTQVGITPVLRWRPSAWDETWFVEVGIGANFLTPIYRSRDRRFSTTFNFGDHLAVGRRFGTDQRHEIALRLQHFSNAGIRRPNPGENFLQLRYAALL